MAYKANEKKDEVMFLYKFVKGECEESFGINVARMAGIPEKVIERARKQAEEFNARLNVLTTKLKMKKQQI